MGVAYLIMHCFSHVFFITIQTPFTFLNYCFTEVVPLGGVSLWSLCLLGGFHYESKLLFIVRSLTSRVIGMETSGNQESHALPAEMS